MKTYIVMINSGYGSTTEAMFPKEVWGPFTSKQQAEDLVDKIEEWLDELDMNEDLCQVIELDDGISSPTSRQELADLLGCDDVEDSEDGDEDDQDEEDH